MIETKRLLLRPFAEDDAADVLEYLAKPAVNCFACMKLDSLEDAGAEMKRICEAINSVSFSQNRGKRPETPEGQIVQDADRLDALGAIGIARTFAYGGEHGRSLDESVEHFHEKLLRLKDELNTETARKAAEPRHAFLVRFLEEYEKEKNQK